MIKLVTDENWQEFTHATPREFGERFAEIHQLVNPTSSLEDVRQAMVNLNDESSMGLDAESIDAFALMINKLSEIERFRGNRHIAPGNGGNTGQHCDAVVVLGDYVLEDITPNRVSTELKQIFAISTLMHDLGETVREFFSLAESVRLSAKELFDTERNIAVFSTKLAYASVATNNPDLYNDTVDEMRELSAPETAADAGRIIDTYIENFNNWPELSSQQIEHIEDQTEMLMKYYDAAETMRGVTGAIVKTMQRTQGEIEFQDNQGKKGGIPWDQVTSGLILGANGRIERGLDKIFASWDFDEQLEMAHAVRDHVYKTAIRHIETMPGVITRRKTLPDEEPEPEPGSPNRHAHYLKLLAEEREARRGREGNLSDTMLESDTITKYHALLLYHAALECKDYIPDGECLLSKREVPEQLKPIVESLHREERAKRPYVERLDSPEPDSLRRAIGRSTGR